MNLVKKIFAALLCSAIIVTPALSLNVHAATFAQVNADDVFVNQQTEYTCTLASNVMMLRRAAMMMGDPNWESITEASCRPTLWNSYGGMICDYQYNGSIKTITVINRRVDELGGKSNPKQFFINMLKEHPEGVVIYDYDRPHAILLTDYTDGVFYCSDPYYTYPKKRIPISQASISVESAESVWYIISPDLKLTTGSTNTSTTTSSSVSTVNETWKVTDEAGLNLRSGAGTSNSIIGFVPQNAVVQVTKKTTNGGYTWGYVTYNSKTGWIALNYATKVANTSTSTNTNTNTNTNSNNSTVSTSKTQTTTVASSQTVYEDTHNVFDNNSTMSASEITLGQSVTLKGIAANGKGPYTYAYYYKRTSQTSWTTIRDFTSSNTASVQPLAATEYDVCVKIKDVNGNIEKKYMKLNVRKSLTNQSTVSQTTAYVGDEITLKAKATGGIGSYSYAYYYKRHENDQWIVLKDFGSDTTAVLKPLKDTDYDICIKVKDASGNVDKVYQTVKVYKALVNNSDLSTHYFRLGETITLKGSATGGSGGYQYAYYYKRAENSDWIKLYDFSSRTSATLTPLKSTTYDICIKVKDSNGKVTKRYLTLFARSK